MLCQASCLLVMQIVKQRYRPEGARDAHEKVTQAAKVLQNLIDGAAPLV